MEQDVRTADHRDVRQTTPGLDADHRSGPERRRPGRPATVNPALLPLLRGEALGQAASLHAGRARRPSDLDPALGLIVSACIGLAIWFAAFEFVTR